jgi:hypothetical protein
MLRCNTPLCEARGVEARGCWAPTSLTCSRRDGYPRHVDAATTYERNDISRLQASWNVNGATGARKPGRSGVLQRAQRAGSLARRRQLRSEGPARWLTISREPARARASGCDGGVDGAFAGGLRAWAGMIDVLTSWTSWTTSHNTSRGRRQTLLVDVDYGWKATSHKGVKRQHARRSKSYLCCPGAPRPRTTRLPMQNASLHPVTPALLPAIGESIRAASRPAQYGRVGVAGFARHQQSEGRVSGARFSGKAVVPAAAGLATASGRMQAPAAPGAGFRCPLKAYVGAVALLGTKDVMSSTSTPTRRDLLSSSAERVCAGFWSGSQAMRAHNPSRRARARTTGRPAVHTDKPGACA